MTVKKVSLINTPTNKPLDRTPYPAHHSRACLLLLPRATTTTMP